MFAVLQYIQIHAQLGFKSHSTVVQNRSILMYIFNHKYIAKNNVKLSYLCTCLSFVFI